MTVEERLEHLEQSLQTITQRVYRLETATGLRPHVAPVPFAPTPAPGGAPRSDGRGTPAPDLRPPRLWDAVSVTPSRVLAAAGGVALLLGIGFLLRYAVAQGWLGPHVRVLLALAASGLLAVVGWRLERTPATRIVGQTCTATATAGAYAAVVAAAIGYHLVPDVLGLAGAVLVAGAAAARGAWTGSRAIAALGVGGALVAPALVRAVEGPTHLAFLSLALGAGVAVAVRRGWTSISVLGFVLVTPQVWQAAAHPEVPLALLGFAAAHGTLFLGASLLHARGRELTESIGAVILLGVNAASVAAIGFWVLQENLPQPNRAGMWLLGVAALHVAAGGAWSRRQFAPPVAVAALLAGMLTADAAILSWFEGARAGYAEAALLTAVLATGAAVASAAWLRPAAPLLVLVQLALVVLHALATVVDVPVVGSLDAILLTVALCAAALLVHAVGRGVGTTVTVAAAAYVGLALVRLLTHEAPLDALLHGPRDLAVVLGMSAAVAGTALLLGQTLHRRFTVLGVTIVNYAVSLAAVAMDPDGAGRVALTGLWAAGGGLALVAGRRLGRRDVRHGGAALLAAAVSKAALVDTSMLSGTNRALALLLCGTALVATAVAEARAAQEPDSAPANDTAHV